MTVFPLVDLWGFGPSPRAAEIPGADQIATALQKTGSRYLQITGGAPFAILKTRDIQLDLSAIAKGYAVDRVAGYLEGLQIRDYLIEIGGELRVAGKSPRGGPWRIAIEAPLVEQRQILDSIEVTDISVATSGDYRNYFEVQGVRYSHTIDPTSGYPVSHQLASVTVFSESAILADALATALNVLGPEEGRLLAEQQNLAVIFLIRGEEGFEQRYSSAMSTLVP